MDNKAAMGAKPAVAADPATMEKAAAAIKNVSKKEGKDKKDKLSPNEIVDRFRLLREEQRKIAGKLTTLEIDKAEHKLVIDTLTKLDGERRCFRLIGEVLVERTVKEVLPALQKNLENIAKSIDTCQEKLVSKGKEINDFREKHNICVQGDDFPAIFTQSGDCPPTTASTEKAKA